MSGRRVIGKRLDTLGLALAALIASSCSEEPSDASAVSGDASIDERDSSIPGPDETRDAGTNVDAAPTLVDDASSGTDRDAGVGLGTCADPRRLGGDLPVEITEGGFYELVPDQSGLYYVSWDNVADDTHLEVRILSGDPCDHRSTGLS